MSHLIITAGPTFEPLDQVRRLTNHSTGKLGTELATFMASRGFGVTLLRGELATFPPPKENIKVVPFTTTESLADSFKALADHPVDAIFHCAAVSDFRFGKIHPKVSNTATNPAQPGKWTTNSGTLMAELVPTTKILPQLRPLFPQAKIIGWKYEVEGNRESAIQKGRQQIETSHTDACVVNGPGYGSGFELLAMENQSKHLESASELYSALLRLIEPLSGSQR